MQVTVAFEFVAGGKTLPAGNSFVELNTESETMGTIVLRGDGQRPIMLLAIGKEYLADPKHSQLVFHRYGTSFFLTEVRTEGDTLGGLCLPVTARRRWRTRAGQTRRSWQKSATDRKEILYV